MGRKGGNEKWKVDLWEKEIMERSKEGKDGRWG
jgi:hypothetical protein